MTDVNILIPKPEEQKEVRPSWHEEWYRRLENKWNPPFEIPNIHFHYYHDDFFNRHLSIRAARDWRNHPFWFYIAVLFMLAQLAVMGFGLSFRIFKPYVPYLPSWT